MPVGGDSPKDQNSNKAAWLDYDDALNGEWSFNIEPSFIASETINNEDDKTNIGETSILIEKTSYEELVATCDAMKVQMKELEEKLEEKKKEDEEKDLKISKLESEICELKEESYKTDEQMDDLFSRLMNILGVLERRETEKNKILEEKMELEEKLENAKIALQQIDVFFIKIKSNHQQIMEKQVTMMESEKNALMSEMLKQQMLYTLTTEGWTQKWAAWNAEKRNLQEKLAEKDRENEMLQAEVDMEEVSGMLKIRKLQNQLTQKDEEIQTVNRKYSNLKKRGVQMLEEKNQDIKKLQREVEDQKKKLEEQNNQLDELKNMIKQESEKRKRFENEMKAAEKIVKDAWREEKMTRKLTEQTCLKEKTEKMALQEKVKELSAKGVVVHKICPNSEHNILVQRIDVLQRQRDILVDSITQRDAGSENTIK
ncbi:Protein CBG13384 [Caenorhabditis briggsae]|uniref:Uncharacterized protein n=2 Tax=Caenorhabditis briggsae TaxID=6238 RepID=A0AAE9ITG0_CAEBR|nr:Protein CBG13384 [Caenorhabditis briggsae]ULU04226.1 hypothetical protein L3Y34_017189 [Caenorhabditis briggsae]CAP32228.1 Protein CBG13384 [Caenorhabditis briggsae]